MTKIMNILQKKAIMWFHFLKLCLQRKHLLSYRCQRCPPRSSLAVQQNIIKKSINPASHENKICNDQIEGNFKKMETGCNLAECHLWRLCGFKATKIKCGTKGCTRGSNHYHGSILQNSRWPWVPTSCVWEEMIPALRTSLTMDAG